MKKVVYEGKADMDILEGIVLDTLRQMKKNAEILGCPNPYFQFAIGAVDTAVTVMESDLYKCGLAREVLPFEPEEGEDDQAFENR